MLTLKDFENDYIDVLSFSFKGVDVRVLRNKHTLDWNFLQEENDELLPLPSDILFELRNMFRPKNIVYNFSQDYNDSKFLESLVVKNDSGETLTINFPESQILHMLAHGGDFSYLDNYIVDALNVCEKILDKYRFSEVEKNALLQKLDGLDITLRENYSLELGIMSCDGYYDRENKKISLRWGNICGRNKEEIVAIIAHEVLHALSDGKEFVGFKDLSLNETITELLIKQEIPNSPGYSQECAIISILLGFKDVPEAVVRAYFSNDDHKAISCLAEDCIASTDEVIKIISPLSAGMSVASAGIMMEGHYFNSLNGALALCARAKIREGEGLENVYKLICSLRGISQEVKTQLAMVNSFADEDFTPYIQGQLRSLNAEYCSTLPKDEGEKVKAELENAINEKLEKMEKTNTKHNTRKK